MRKVGYLFGALLFLATALTPVFAQQPFADVPLNHWAYNAVNSLAEQGLLEGYPDGTFQGKQRLTRYEFAQAVARLMDRMEQMGGIPGPPGPPGAPGPPAVGAGLTPEQKATLDRLAKEFGPELKALRSDLDSLTERVEDLEAAPKAELPAITVSGDISWRVGLYGTDLGTEDESTTGYPFAEEVVFVINGGNEYYAPYGGINIPYYDPTSGLWTDDPSFVGGPVYTWSIPITDALKDAYKPSDFMTMKTRVNFCGQLAEDTDVKVGLLAGPETNSYGDPMHAALAGSPLWLSGNGIMDEVSVDEAWLKYRTQVLLPAELTVGKQYFARSQGLLADNDQEAIKAFRIDWAKGDWCWGALWGMLDREMFWGRTAGAVGLPALAPASPPDPTTSGQDNYNLYYLDWAFAEDWNLGGSWLESGFNEEQGWSFGLDGSVGGIDWYGEYAQLTQWPSGDDFNDLNADGIVDAGEVELDESDTAWLTGLRWANAPVCVTGEYGQIDAGYALAPWGGWSPLHPLLSGMVNTDYFTLPLSGLHPNAAVDPHDINWIDRPLFLDPTNIAKGWHVNVTFPNLLGHDTPLSVSYMDGDGYEPRYISWLSAGGSSSGISEPEKWRDADPVWVVKVSRQLSEDVSANVLYGRREADNILSPQDVPIISGATDYYAENDPIQVIRAEVCVAF
jgi:hypothetical protein